MRDEDFPTLDEIYQEIGCDREVESIQVKEDPVLNVGNDAHLRTREGFISFFASRDFEGSPAQGYELLADNFTNQLDRMASATSDANDETAGMGLALPVRVLPEGPPFSGVFNSLNPAQQRAYLEAQKSKEYRCRVYEFEQTAASRAFRGAIDILLHTGSPKIEKNLLGETSAKYYGRFYEPGDDGKGRDVYLELIESFGKDEVGEYQTLELRIPVPAYLPTQEILVNPADHKPESTGDELATKREGRREKRQRRARMKRWNTVLDKVIDLELPPEREKAVLAALRTENVTQPGEASVIIDKLAS